MTIRILYLARLREVFASGSEDFDLPASIRDVRGLIECLSTRGGTWTTELATGRAVRVAVNQVGST